MVEDIKRVRMVGHEAVRLSEVEEVTASLVGNAAWRKESSSRLG